MADETKKDDPEEREAPPAETGDSAESAAPAPDDGAPPAGPAESGEPTQADEATAGEGEVEGEESEPVDAGAKPDVAPPAEPKAAAWGRPLARLDFAWTHFEARLCAVVLVLEVMALSLWVALKGLSSPPDSGSPAGTVFRAITGALVLGSLGYFATKKQSLQVRRGISLAGVVLGFLGARLWAKTGVDYGSNFLNWYQQASSLTLLGGLRGVGTRLTLLLALLGGSLATAAGKHITIDLVTRFLNAKARLPVVVVGWLGSAVICAAGAWGFFDHIAIENFGAEADASVGAKISDVGKGLGEDWFVLRKQLSLDMKALPHVLKGERYADWFGGTEWNQWVDDEGFADRYGKEKADALKLPADAKRSPIVVIPDKGEPRGELINAANLVFPTGLLIIALRFILLSLLALSGHKSIEAEGEGMDIQRPADEPTVEGDGT